MTQENLIVLGFFIGLSTILYFFADFFSEEGEDSSRQLDRLRSYVEQTVKEYESSKAADAESDNRRVSKDEEPAAPDPFAPDMKGANQVLQNLGIIVARFTPKKYLEEKQKQLVQADLPLKANEFVAIQMFIAALGSLIIRVITKNAVLMIPGLVFGMIVPIIWLKIVIARRQSAFQEQILDMLMMTANGLKAGYSFLQSMELVCKEGSPPMQRELGKVIRENGLGMNLEDSMNAMNDRVASPDWDLVTTVVMIQRQIGGNLAEILEKIGSTIRTRLQIKGEISAKTAQGRASGFIVGALPFFIGIMVYQSNPTYISKLWTFEHGKFKGLYVTIAALIWECIGIWVILKIVDIDV